MMNFSKISIMLNNIMYNEKDKPLCYTLYKNNSIFYKVINIIFFWQKNHCRKVYLMLKVKENANYK